MALSAYIEGFNAVVSLKQHCRKRGDVIDLYYRATYAYRVEEFDRLMVKMKSIYSKVHDELLEVGIQKFSRWLKQAYTMVFNTVLNPEAWDLADNVRIRVVLPWKKKRLT
ncbi:hypothetical protein Ddye_004316 [Dipteronia dyeriana]|uniref:Uncharacterized protein n=1 Tax=Dipteronia dyeriana TaxID=168575 RepID=A0AAE0CW45_9ROSI|nr:hypothetical protein Ddye_004316 [Dipteronia dyeriana]